MLRISMAVLCIAMCTGCAQQSSLYNWGNYEQAYYAYTKDPGETDAYLEALNEIITDGEEKNRVPPGLYAEYGYTLMLVGRTDEAMANFGKEREKWPESRKLMDLMIAGPQDDRPPSGVQPNIGDREPHQATPAGDAAIVDAPLDRQPPQEMNQ